MTLVNAASYALPIDPEVPPPPALIANRVEFRELPIGISRVLIELVGDGLACGIRVPVLVARGADPGPVFGISAAIHGNELNGIEVIHDLFRELDPKALKGTLVAVVAANVPGVHLNQRDFSNGDDLNRIMPGREGGTESQVYAHRLLYRIVRQMDWLVDLHTASSGRVNSLYIRADLSNPVTARMAGLLHPQIILHDPAKHTTLRGAAMALGIPSVTVEVGDPQRFQDRYIAQTLEGIWRVLHHAGCTDVAPPASPHERPEICEASYWLYTDRGGLLQVAPKVTTRVKKGERIATVANAFGDVIRNYECPEDGIVIGRSVNPVGQTGARILHLGRIAPQDSPLRALLHDNG